jgi:hypothetical protein
MASIASFENDSFFFSLFNQDSQPDTRASMLADLVDPTIMENFAFGNGWNDFSSFLNGGHVVCVWLNGSTSSRRSAQILLDRPAQRPWCVPRPFKERPCTPELK